MTEASVTSNGAPAGRLVVRAALRTDVGLVRSENQDFGTYTTTEEERRSHPGGRLLIVADGMGGHRGGATASRLAGETIKSLYLDSPNDIPNALRTAVSQANARIFAESQTNPELRGMGTTTSALAVRNNRAWFAHVGDSRIYLVRSGDIQQLTDDHSLVATMVREGLLTPQEAETHPRRNVLHRSMGVAEDVEIDIRGPIEIREDDVFILCSDGLHGLVKLEEMKEVAALPIEKAADEYLRRALERGAPDNVTVIVARVERDFSEVGDETLVDADSWDETQPMTPLPNGALDALPIALRDDSVPESEKVTAEMPLEASLTSPQDVSPNDKTVEMVKPATPTADTEPGGTPVPREAGGSGGKLMLLLLVAMILVAAGAWYFVGQSPAPATAPHSSSR